MFFGGKFVKRQNSTAAHAIPETVESYLRDNPDCLIQRPDLLRSLTPPSRYHGDESIADFQKAVIQGLRSDLDRLSRESADIVSLSQSNLSQQQRTHAAALLLLQAETPADLHRVLSHDWPPLLQVDAIILALEDPDCHELHEGPSKIMHAPSGMIDAIFSVSDNPRVLLTDYRAGNRLFGSLMHQIQSDALARIDTAASWETPQSAHGHTPIGLLALGSFTPQTFHPDQASDLLEFLARLIGFTLTRWRELTP
jgi:uncharacterized protein YigA (DUF484 family)